MLNAKKSFFIFLWKKDEESSNEEKFHFFVDVVNVIEVSVYFSLSFSTATATRERK